MWSDNFPSREAFFGSPFFHPTFHFGFQRAEEARTNFQPAMPPEIQLRITAIRQVTLFLCFSAKPFTKFARFFNISP